MKNSSQRSRCCANSVYEFRGMLFQKHLVILGLLFTTAMALTLLGIHLTNWTSPNATTDVIQRSPSTVGIVVQIISHFFGAIHVFALCTMIQLSGSSHFAKNPFSLNAVKFVNALHGHRFDFSLPVVSRLAVLVFIAFTLIPSALWAGSLTPSLTTKQTSSGTILVPYYKNDFGISNVPEHGATPENLALGLFTFDPQKDLQGLMLNSAEGASTFSGPSNATVHTKLDRTKYSYMNRSYGVGAGVGLTDTGLSNRVVAYQYNETGFNTSTSCSWNASSNFGLKRSNGQPSDWLLQAWEVVGQLPNSGNEFFDYVAADISNQPTILAVGVVSNNDTHYAGIATNGNVTHGYPFNNAQCVMTFTPTRYQVSVNVINQTISVLPTNDTVDQAQDHWLSNDTITTLLKNRAVSSIQALSEELSTALYVNPLGAALSDNVLSLGSSPGFNSTPGSKLYDNTRLRAVENVFTSLMDNALVSYGSAQIMLLDDTYPVEVTISTQAYTFAASTYVYPLTVLNFLICAIFIVEAIRTRNWRHLPRFEFMDVKSVIVAASEGGTGIAQQLRAMRQKEGLGWSAGEDRRLAGSIRARLGVSEEDGRPAIMVVGPEAPRSRATEEFEDVAFRDEFVFQEEDATVPLKNMGGGRYTTVETSEI